MDASAFSPCSQLLQAQGAEEKTTMTLGLTISISTTKSLLLPSILMLISLPPA